MEVKKIGVLASYLSRRQVLFCEQLPYKSSFPGGSLSTLPGKGFTACVFSYMNVCFHTNRMKNMDAVFSNATLMTGNESKAGEARTIHMYLADETSLKIGSY